MPGMITAPAVKILSALFGTTGELSNPGGVFQLGNGNALYIPVTNPCEGNGLQQLWADNVPPPLPSNARMLKSIDNGATWAEIDAAHAPAVSLTNHTANTGATSPLTAVLQDANTILVAYVKWDYHSADAPVLAFSIFHMDTGLWGAETTGGPAFPNALQGGSGKIHMAYRATDGSVIIAWAGVPETVGGTPYLRIFYTIYNAGWSAAAPIDATQTGATLNYDLGGVVSGTAGRSHFFYTIQNPPVSNAVNSRTLNGANALLTVVVVAPLDPSAGINFPISYAGNIGVAYIRGFPVSFFSTAVSADVPVFSEQALPNIGGNPGGVATVYVSSSLGGVDGAGQNAWSNPSATALGWSGVTFVFMADPMFPSTSPTVGSPISLGMGVVVTANLPGETTNDTQLYFFAFSQGACPKNAQGV